MVAGVCLCSGWLDGSLRALVQLFGKVSERKPSRAPSDLLVRATTTVDSGKFAKTLREALTAV